MVLSTLYIMATLAFVKNYSKKKLKLSNNFRNEKIVVEQLFYFWFVVHTCLFRVCIFVVRAGLGPSALGAPKLAYSVPNQFYLFVYAFYTFRFVWSPQEGRVLRIVGLVKRPYGRCRRPA